MAYLQTRAVSHAQRVRSLYKEAVRNLESTYGYHRHVFRYHAVLLRARFDEHANEMDARKAKKLLLDGEHELWLKMHPQPIKFPNSPGGVAYAREPHVSDWILDVWHPLEKAQYPEYFALREIRKKEFIERWEKKYGHVNHDDAHH
ncbi:NADH dehydrogenase [ubiquinone] 1 beta subcomplex subunit 9-like [Pomacea canaliculata]|uniref:NADH dehydrogenase [ubiquinone] 1 beta subcomplex subunit 9-like n=1 Tax=Pomacea canaliculata TaxID=400727 RepID=UPI000D73696B|nr:NADH dehydrogenase [ubiquinone] 1 beta subcomplex subunit 9-like [Pomacea canaliculata]